jgi:glutaryl-CoA dehydrogenase
MPNFPGVDFMDFDSLLTSEEKLARQTARQFVDDRVLPIIEKYNQEAKAPLQLVAEMAELGFFGANLEGYGCAGLSTAGYGLVMQELERGDSAVRSFASVQSSLVMYPIHAYGSDAQKEKWLPLMQQGKAIGCFGLTEPQFGSNAAGMLTRATKSGTSYVLNGEKMWITNGSISDVALVWAKCEEEDGAVRGFLIEKDTPGFKSWDIHGKLSLRASVTSGLAMTDCRIPAENMLPGVKGMKGPLSCLTQFLALQVARLKDAGKVLPVHVSMLKMNNVWMARECARLAREILGANGIVDDYCVMRHMNNLETVFTYEGTHEMHKLIIGQHITGIPAF